MPLTGYAVKLLCHLAAVPLSCYAVTRRRRGRAVNWVGRYRLGDAVIHVPLTDPPPCSKTLADPQSAQQTNVILMKEINSLMQYLKETS